MSSLLIDERNKLIGENLRKYRLLKGLTQDELAEGICSVSQLSKVENGKTYLKRDLLKQMAHRLGVTIERVESQDAMLEELSEKLQLANDALKVNQASRALEVSREVSKQAREFEYTDLLVNGVLMQSKALNKCRQYLESSEVIKELLESDIQLETLHRIELYINVAYSYELCGDRLTAHEYYCMADDLVSNVQGSASVRIGIYFGLARCHFSLHNNRTAFRYYEMTEKLAAELSHHLYRIRSTYMKATTLKRMGEWERSEQIFLSVLKEAEENNLLFEVGFINNNMGQLFQERGEYGQARVHYDRALRVFELLNESVYACDPLNHIAELAIIQNELHIAEQQIRKVFEISGIHPVEAHAAKAKATRTLGWIYGRKGLFDKYVSQLEIALELFEQRYLMLEASDTAKELAEALYQKDDPRSVEMYRKTLTYYEQSLEFGKRR